MNKERYNQIIDEVYNNYINKCREGVEMFREQNPFVLVDYREDTKETFIKSIKDNKHWFTGEENFSEKWGLKIEERELTYDEKVHEARRRFGFELEDGTRTFDINKTETIKFLQSTQRIISLTYNNETIEVYE